MTVNDMQGLDSVSNIMKKIIPNFRQEGQDGPGSLT